MTAPTGTEPRTGTPPVPGPADASVARALRRGQEAAAELVIGAVLVGITGVAGLWFAVRPAAGRLDGWLLELVTPSRSRWYIDLTALHRPWVVVTGAVIAAVIAFPQDRLRSLACLVGPPLALILCEVVVKPAVGRTLGGSLSFPSGSTVGAAALATAAVLATPARWRAFTAVLGAAYSLWMAVAVVALQWHYPTDALGGLAFGVGVVLLVDGVAWLAVHRGRNRGRQEERVGPSGVPPSR